MNNIDKRRHYILMIDTETANTFNDGKGLDYKSALVYDCGFAVIDTRGNIYETYSFVNSDIFNSPELMASAYYASKIPMYLTGLENGSRVMADTYTIRKTMLSVMEKYGITEICAHNARFDVAVLNSTIRYISKSRIRYWFPFGMEVWDSMKMARSTICKNKTYNYYTSNGRKSATAENLYKYISHNENFIESHTGLEDVLIESIILVKCLSYHKKMNKRLFANK